MFRVPPVIVSTLLSSLKQSNQGRVGIQTTILNLSPYSTSASKDVREVQIPVPWGHISGKWWGDVTTQPVLGIHGRQDNANSFDRLVPLLDVPSFLALDMPGHGRSSHYPVGQGYHFSDEVVNIRRVARHFKWSKLTLVGHSLGSCMSLAYAGYFPDGVAKLVSLDCVRGAVYQDHANYVANLQAVIESNLQVEERMGRPPPSYKYDDIVDLYLQGSHGSLTRDSCKIILERGLTKTEDGKYYLSRDPRMKWFVLGGYDQEVLHTLLGQVTCDVLSIRGLQGFAVGGHKEEVFLSTLAVMEKSARRFRSEDVEGTHHVHLNEPEKVASIINEFFLCDEAQPTTTIY